LWSGGMTRESGDRNGDRKKGRRGSGIRRSSKQNSCHVIKKYEENMIETPLMVTKKKCEERSVKLRYSSEKKKNQQKKQKKTKNKNGERKFANESPPQRRLGGEKT